jgi:hypothetical protein
MGSSYSDFLVTHPPLFSEPTDPLDADSWLHTTESNFRLLHCAEYQKTLYTTQQLRGSAGASWLVTPPHCRTTIRSHGVSSVLHSVITIFCLASCATNSRNSWSCNRDPAVSMNMATNSTTWCIMVFTTLTPMRRR